MESLYLGVKFGGHDSAIFAVFPESKRLFGMSTERLTRYKHDIIPPIVCLKKMGEYFDIDLGKVEKLHISHSFLPVFENELQDPKKYKLQIHERKFFNVKYISEHRQKRQSFNKLPNIIKIIKYISNTSGRYIIFDLLRKIIGIKNDKKMLASSEYIHKELSVIFPNAEIDLSFHDHEYCHVISSYFTSKMEGALLISMDGHGDNNVYSRAYTLNDGTLEEVSCCVSPARFFNFNSPGGQKRTECSVGGIYTYFTDMLGFERNADEGKVEALAAYGDSNIDVYHQLISCVHFDRGNDTISIDLSRTERLFNYDAFQALLRQYSKEDLAAAVQKFLEDVISDYVRYLVEKTGIRQLCFSGGVFANVILNLKIFEEITPDIFITPAIADDGSAQGAAFANMLDHGYSIQDLSWVRDAEMPYFGTSYSRAAIKEAIEHHGGRYELVDLGEAWPEVAADRVCSGQIGAIYHGRMEWGPRALGNRSIIADPRNPNSRDLLNKEIKCRPAFQPFCPSVLAEEKERLFENAYLNKHMTCAFRMREEHHEALPSSIHIDGTSRVQFVEEKDNPDYYRLLKRVKEISGYGMVLNTSFNRHGRTIVETPNDAITDFLDTNMDFVILEGYLLIKE